MNKPSVESKYECLHCGEQVYTTMVKFTVHRISSEPGDFELIHNDCDKSMEIMLERYKDFEFNWS